VVRIYDQSHHAEADLIMVHSETIDTKKPLTIFHPHDTWKKKTYENYSVKEMHQVIFEAGKLVYQIPSLKETREYVVRELNTLWEEIRRFDNPHIYYVDLSKKLWDIKQKLLPNH
jgi:nicotinate phosphoribosyltransferase